jgi:DNA-binding LytR/AlgR family response regulator
MKCLIVDDEPLACDILENYINQLEGLSLVGRCENALQAISVLQVQAVDLLFLDIQMPQLTGLDLLRNFKVKPQVILTTAFSQYAFDAFELDVVDYLLKPFSFERFARAVAKVRKIQNEQITFQSSPSYFFFKSDKKLHKLTLDEILFIEGLSNYLKVYTPKEVLVIRETMKKIEDMLPAEYFFRIHKSYIVGINHIDYIEGNVILLKQNYQVPIGETYKDEFLKKIYP